MSRCRVRMVGHGILTSDLMRVYGINPVLEALRAGRVTCIHASVSAAGIGCANC